MKKHVSLLIFSFLALSLTAQVQVFPLSGPFPEKGVKYKGEVTYALPTTTLKVTVSVSKVREVRGHFADYAESLLGLTNIIQQNRTYYQLNTVAIEPLRTADLKKCYRAYSSDAAIADDWKDNATRLPQTFPCDSSLTAYQTHTASLPEFFKNYADISYTQQSEAFVDTKIIDGVVTQVPASHTKTVSKSFESKAREAADAIAKSRRDQYNLAAGEQETPYSGEALRTMLSELKNWESNYMSLFTGVSVSDTETYVFYVTPENLDAIPLFYFSSDKGFNREKGTSSEAYSLVLKRVYPDMLIGIAEVQFPSYNYITRNARPVKVSLQNGATVHDFGIVDMYQAGSLQFVSPHTKRPVDMNTIGIVF